MIEPPFNLDPHVAIRDPDSLPTLMVRAMHGIIEAEKRGSMAERFIKGFNVAAWTLTTAGRKKTGQKTWKNEGNEARLKQGTLELAPAGLKLEEIAKRKPDTHKRRAEIKRWAKKIYSSDKARYDQTWQAANHRG